MPTRVYLPYTAIPPAITPAVPTGAGKWTEALGAGFIRSKATRDRVANDTPTNQQGQATSGTNPSTVCMRQYIFGPLAAQTLTGNVTGVIKAAESNAGYSATIAIGIRLVDSAGTHKVDLIAPATASDLATTPPPEFATTTPASRRFQDAAEATSLALPGGGGTSVAAGDYIVIEIGWRKASTSTSYRATLQFGAGASADLPFADASTSAYNPWVEFSGVIGLQQFVSLEGNQPSATGDETHPRPDITIDLGDYPGPQVMRSGVSGPQVDPPRSVPDYEIFNAAAMLGPECAAYQLSVKVPNPDNGKWKWWFLPYGLFKDGWAHGNLLIYDPFWSEDPYQNVAAWQKVDLKAVTGNAACEGFLGAVLGPDGNVYLCPSMTTAITGTLSSNPWFFRYRPAAGLPTDGTAWDAVNIGPTANGGSNVIPSLAWCGWVGNCADPEWIYYTGALDYVSGVPHGVMVRFHTGTDYFTSTNWEAIALHTGGQMLSTYLRGMQGCVYTPPVAATGAPGRVWFAPTDNAQEDGSSYVAVWNCNGANFRSKTGGWDFFSLMHTDPSNVPLTFAEGDSQACHGYVGIEYVLDRWIFLVPYQYGSGATGVANGHVTWIDTQHPDLAGSLHDNVNIGNAFHEVDITQFNVRAKGYQGLGVMGNLLFLVPCNAGDVKPPPITWLDLSYPDWTSRYAWDFLETSPAMPWQTYCAADNDDPGPNHDGHLYFIPLFDFTAGRPASGRFYRVTPLQQADTSQHLHPAAGSIGDTLRGFWTAVSGGVSGGTTDLWDTMDETTSDDSDYVESEDDPAASGCTIALGPGLFPKAGPGKVKFRVSESSGGGSITMQLLQGASTVIAEWTETLPGTPTTFEETLTAEQAATITNAGDLRLHWVTTA
jgi:hypothetical protein